MYMSSIVTSFHPLGNYTFIFNYTTKCYQLSYIFSDLTLELPFTLTHPKPKHRVISQMVSFPPRSSLSSATDNSKATASATATSTTTKPGGGGDTGETTENKAADTSTDQLLQLPDGG